MVVNTLKMYLNKWLFHRLILNYFIWTILRYITIWFRLGIRSHFIFSVPGCLSLYWGFPFIHFLIFFVSFWSFHLSFIFIAYSVTFSFPCYFLKCFISTTFCLMFFCSIQVFDNISYFWYCNYIVNFNFCVYINIFLF